MSSKRRKKRENVLWPYAAECESGVFRVLQAYSPKHIVQRLRDEYQDRAVTINKVNER